MFGPWRQHLTWTCPSTSRLSIPEFEKSDWSPKGWKSKCQFQTEHLHNEFTSSVVDCRNACLMTERCTNYNWNNRTGSCQLNAGLVHKSDATDSHDPDLFCGLVPVIWLGKPSSRSCTFIGNDLLSTSITVRGGCEAKCDSTEGCTHYAWTSDNKTCFLKSGFVNKYDAYYTHDHLSACGFCRNCLFEPNRKF